MTAGNVHVDACAAVALHHAIPDMRQAGAKPPCTGLQQKVTGGAFNAIAANGNHCCQSEAHVQVLLLVTFSSTAATRTRYQSE